VKVILLSNRILIAIDTLALSGHETSETNLALFLGTGNNRLVKTVSLLKKRRLLNEITGQKIYTLTQFGHNKVRVLHKRCDTVGAIMQQVPESMMLNGDGMMIKAPRLSYLGHRLDYFRR
jgi:hypothetical protein